MEAIKHQENGSIVEKYLHTISPIEFEKSNEKLKLAARIDDLRSQLNLSKSQLAKLTGKHPAEITKWLSGTHNFTLDTLAEIAFALNVPIASFFDHDASAESHFVKTCYFVKSNSALQTKANEFYYDLSA